MYSLKNLSSILIYHNRSWCSICKQLHRGLSLKNSFQTLLYALQNNSTLLPINNMSFIYTYQKCCSAPTHFLVNTVFPKVCIKPYALINSSKRIFQLRDACTSPLMDCWSLHILLASLGLTKTFWLHHIQLFFNKSIKECSFDIHLPDFIKCGNC